jgi:hypothetical protein
MAHKAAQAEAKIANICHKMGISRDGLFWMDHALDPFKDLVKPHSGYPDKIMEPSIVEVVKQTAVVVAPGSNVWNASIFLDQVLCNTDQFLTQMNANIAQSSGQLSTPWKRGGLVVRTADTGTDLSLITTKSNLVVDPTLYANEKCRIVAIGMEVHDTTAELDKQGSCIVWRLDKQPNEHRVLTFTADLGVTACIPTSDDSIRLDNPPFNASEALDILGSQQWEAKDGAYIVPVMVESENSPKDPGQLCVITVEGPNNNYLPTVVTTGVGKLTTCPATNVQSPYSMCGALFTGLKPTASLTINFNYMIERFPNKSSVIKRLCYPSPPYDVKALELYSDIARQLPIGVPVHENAAGDWIKAVAQIAGSICGLIPHPAAKTIGMGLSLVEKTIPVIMENIPKKEKAITNRVTEVTSVSKSVSPNGTITTTTTKKPQHATVMVASGNFKSNTAKHKRPNRTKMAVNKSGVIVADNPWKSKKH